MPPLTNELVGNAVRDKLDPKKGGPLPAEWNAYYRRDMGVLPGDKWPLVYVDVGQSEIIEDETDNRCLVGYPVAVCLQIKEATGKRTDPDLASLRRIAQGAVYTTAYPGLAVEDVRLSEDPGVDLPSVIEEGVTAVGFSLMIGLLEVRCPLEAVP